MANMAIFYIYIKMDYGLNDINEHKIFNKLYLLHFYCE